jgi:hypothetical protein
MTILNIANDGFFNVLIVLCRAVSLEHPIEKDKLIEICSNRQESSITRLKQTLLRWTQLGLFVEEDGKISFCPQLLERAKGRNKPDSIKLHLPAALRELIFREENNQNFWDTESTKAEDFTRAVCWVLAQDIYTFSLDSSQKSQELEAKQVKDPDKRPIQNDVRLNGLRFWSHFLGFTWKSRTIMIDPTEAIRQECQVLFEKNREYPVSDFLNSLATKLPVIDGGSYRKKVEEVLDPQHWRKPDKAETLSASLSRALWRLDLSGVLALETRADAHTNRVLQRQDGQEFMAFTHVIYQGVDR